MLTAAIALAVLAALYLYGTRTFRYWEKKGIKHDKPIVLVGNNAQVYLMQKSITQMAAEMYWKYPKEKVVGFYRSTHPELVIRDPEIVKRILLTDFQYFYPRGLNPHKTVIEPMLRNLFFADGDLWRLLRQRMTPAFTSGKLKAMFPLIVERAEKLQARALGAAAAGRPLDARDLMARYTTDFIGACGFGLDADSLNDEHSAFRKLGASIFKVGVKEVFIGMLKEMFPEWCKHLKYLGKVEQPMINLVSAIIKQRNYESSGRNDFIDLLLECKKKGKMMVESVENVKIDGTPEIATLELTDELIAAQVFVFFAAGFETSSSATSFTLHQLAYHPEVQRKVQQEIDAVLAKNGGCLSYDAVKEMTYLECAFKEAMRMFPSLGFLIRQCARTYTIPELDVTIDPDVGVLIPLQALHNDPQYFPEPHEFRPERFLPEQQDDNTKFVYLPFGEGPRACIGLRLGLMQSLAGLAAVLARVSVAPARSSLRRPVVDPKSGIVQSISGGLPLSFIERNPSAAAHFLVLRVSELNRGQTDGYGAYRFEIEPPPYDTMPQTDTIKYHERPVVEPKLRGHVSVTFTNLRSARVVGYSPLPLTESGLCLSSENINGRFCCAMLNIPTTALPTFVMQNTGQYEVTASLGGKLAASLYTSVDS